MDTERVEVEERIATANCKKIRTSSFAWLNYYSQETYSKTEHPTLSFLLTPRYKNPSLQKASNTGAIKAISSLCNQNAERDVCNLMNVAAKAILLGIFWVVCAKVVYVPSLITARVFVCHRRMAIESQPRL